MTRSKRMTFMFDHKAITQAVKDHGLTMEQFLKRAKVNESTWYRWVGGETSPNMKTLKKVQDLLDKLDRKRS